MRKFAVLFALVLLSATAALAQLEPKPLEVPKTELYLGYGYTRADTTGSPVAVDNTKLNGVVFEFSHYLAHSNLGFTLDLGRGSNRRVDSTGIKYVRATYLGGLSYRIHNKGFFTANVHGLAGIDRDDFTQPENQTSFDYQSTNFAAAAGVTLDGNLSTHLGIRLAQVDYVYTNHYSSNQSSIRYTGGVVLRF